MWYEVPSPRRGGYEITRSMLARAGVVFEETTCAGLRRIEVHAAEGSFNPGYPGATTVFEFSPTGDLLRVGTW